MNKKIFYGKRTIIFFVILCVLGLFLLNIRQFFISGSFNIGFPFLYKGVGIGASPEYSHSYFNVVNLILDIIIYYILSVLISFSLSFKKK